MAAGKPTITIAISDAVLSTDDINEMVAAMGTEFDVVRGPLPPRGGPDYFPLILHVAMATLQNLGPNIASSAIWDGLKLWLVRHRSIPRHYEPDNRVEPHLEIEAEEVTAERRFTVVARVYTGDETTLRHAIETLPREVGKLYGDTGAEDHQLAYQTDEEQWRAWSQRADTSEWFEREPDQDEE